MAQYKARPDVSERMKGNKYRLNKSPSNKKHSVNESYFHVIDDEKKAYYLGLVAADGTVNLNDGYRFAISLNDKHILDEMLSDIEYTGAIRGGVNKAGNRYYTLYLSDKIFVMNLVDKGIIPRKTHNMCIPDLPSKLIRHYIRGYLDGDGYISNGKLFCVGVAGQKNIIQWIADHLVSQGVIKSNGIHVHTKNKPDGPWVLKRSQYQARKVCEYIYHEANRYLTRKHNKYMEYCHAV